MSQSQRGKKLLSQSSQEEELTDQVVNAAVKAILTLDHTKRPIKHSDILHCVSNKIRRKMIPQLWEKVDAKLAELGMTLVDCTGGAQTKVFLLISNSMDSQVIQKYSAQKERADRTLLILILAFIFMKDGAISEDELLRHLSNLRIKVDANDEYFGEVKKKLQGQYVQQLYLTRTAIPEQEVFEVRWGRRAELEIPLKAVLEFVCKVGYDNQIDPKNWVSQYERVQNSSES